MKSLSYSELRSYSSWIQNEMDGAQLQDAWTNGQVIVLQFYKFKEKYLVIDSGVQTPWVAVSNELPKVPKKPKPALLFLHAHGKNLRWEKIWTDQAAGRILYLNLTTKDRNCEIEIRLIPNSFNLIIRTGDKSVAWEKPRELPPSQNAEEAAVVERDWADWSGQALKSLLGRKVPTKGVGAATSLSKILEKKRGALVKLQESLLLPDADRWQELGEILKMGKPPGPEWDDLYQSKLSISENREKAFQKSKDLRRKKEGTLTRQKILEKEIAILEGRIQNGETVEKTHRPSVGQKILKKTESKARRRNFEPGFEAVLGKSGADNLAILRQARAWDYWVHLKDYPGAHAIVFRQRDQDIPRKVLQEVSEWVISESLSPQQQKMLSKYDVVIVECRHVRPIKGDKLGRVTYHNPQVFSFASKP